MAHDFEKIPHAPKGPKTKYPWDRDVADSLLTRLRDGESLLQICRDADMPSSGAVYNWREGKLGAPASFKDEYARARLAQAEHFAHEIMSIADSLDERVRQAMEDAVDEIDPSEFEDEREYRRAVNKAQFFAKRRSVEAARLQIDARKWTAGRMNPEAWGDKVQVNTDPKNPPTVKLDLKSMPTEALEKIAALEEQLKQSPDTEEAANVGSS